MLPAHRSYVSTSVAVGGVYEMQPGYMLLQEYLYIVKPTIPLDMAELCSYAPADRFPWLYLACILIFLLLVPDVLQAMLAIHHC